MSEHDSFEDRLRAMADQVSQSVRRMSELDVDEIAEMYGIDAERARSFADVAGRWLSDRVSSAEPRFNQSRPGEPGEAGGTASPRVAADDGGSAQAAANPGPHPLDLPTDHQGLALSALDSGRWTVGPGSIRLVSSGEGAPPPGAADLVSELRARDWVTADGTLTLVGRHALSRWCRAAEGPTRQPSEPDDALPG